MTMGALQVFEVPGLSPSMVQRGDLMANLSDLIAAGALAAVEIDPRSFRSLLFGHGAVPAWWIVEWRLEVALQRFGAGAPETDRVLQQVDERVGELLKQGPLAVVSSHGPKGGADRGSGVFASPRAIDGVGPDRRLRLDVVVSHIKTLRDGS